MISRQEHKRIIAQGMDVPEERPQLPLPLDRVGISSNLVWVRLKNMLLPFDSTITVDLPATVRGIHMSRIEDVVSRAMEKNFEFLREYAAFLASEILQTQRGKEIEVYLEGHIPFTLFADISGKKSMEGIKVFIKTNLQTDNEPVHELGMEVCHITACPCTQAYLDTYLKDGVRALPPATHSQRTMTRLSVEDVSGQLDFEDLFHCLQDVLHLTQGLLKRPDEAELVLAAHERPQFVEDVVRDICESVVHLFSGRIGSRSLVSIESVSIESIHTHNVIAGIRKRFGEIQSCFQESQAKDVK